MDAGAQACSLLQPLIAPLLSDDDDICLWEVAMQTVFADVEYLCSHNPDRKFVSARVARCSHWLRPHQTRWKANGGLAWPTGYGGTGFSRQGFPLYDRHKSVLVHWHAESATWARIDPRKRFKSRQHLMFHMIIPARTRRHQQAAVYTCWGPGSPPLPTTELVQFYGFRKRPNWRCVADEGPEEPYELVASET